MNRLLLIDGYSQIYRAFYAIRGLSNSRGQASNAVHGLAKLLFRLEREYPSGHGAFTLDLGKPAFRLELAPEYKANRPPMPEELRSQMPYIRRWVHAAGWPILEHKGLEADDIIAGLAAEFADFEVLILSSDKDIAQVISDRVKMLVPNRAGGGVGVRGPEEVVAKFAVSPPQIIDYLALIGDSSDNIPGVPGIGPKTAAKLLSEHGDMAGIIAAVDSMENAKLATKIRGCGELLEKNRRLIKLNAKLPVDAWKNKAAVARRKPDWDELTTIADELDLHSVAADIAKMRKTAAEATPPPAPKPLEMHTPDMFDF